jgi:AmmeMemoRadiSam system protein B/AmmeMemoRadiSam system protein A
MGILEFFLSMLIIFCLFSFNCKTQPKMEVEKKAMNQQQIKRSAVAGSWYTNDPAELRTEIGQYLENAKLASINGDILALISPHAGYIYSGFTAANSYKQVMGNKYDAVILIAPSHREMFHGVSVYDGDGYETPLGIVPIEKSIAAAIVKNNDKIRFSMDGHHEEHSLEIQLPFLQVAIPDLKIVPIVFWDHSWSNCQLLAEAITKAVKAKKVLFVASSDLYHGESYKDCKNTDNNTLKHVVELKPEKLCQGFERQEFMACGAGGIVVAEIAAMNLGADKAKIVYQTNSNDVTGNKGGYVVGYGAVAIYKEEKSREEKKVGVESGLSIEEKKELLTIARQTIKNSLDEEALPTPKFKYSLFKEKRGAFVTLHKNKMLRGCIGYVFAYKPLEETIIEMAQAAAFRDPRFPPLDKNEFNDLEIEISVLTPIREIKDIDEIEVGKHGIIIESGMNSGLLLPQVATEYGWDRETFLGHTCQKAGLPKNTWKKEGTTIKIFSADVFHEE